MAAKYEFGSKTHRPLDPDNPPDGWYHYSKLREDLESFLKDRGPDFQTGECAEDCRLAFEKGFQWGRFAGISECAEGLHD